MQAYLDLLRHVRDHGHDHADRTGVGRRSVFGATLRFDLSDGFPFITTRAMNTKLFVAEMLFFTRGWTNVAKLNEMGTKMWDEWAVKPDTVIGFIDKLVERKIVPEEARFPALMEFPKDLVGEIGPMYGAMWRSWPRVSDQIQTPAILRSVDQLPSDLVHSLTLAYRDLPDNVKAETSLEHWLFTNYYSHVDQLNELILNLKQDPWSSRHCVTAFNPELTPVPGYSPAENVLLQRGSLMPCHTDFQCMVSPPKEEGGKLRLSLRWSQRSVDVPIGLPTNISGYALLLSLLAHVTDMDAYELVFMGTDVHIYANQLEGVEEQLTREPRPLPTLWLNPEQKDLFAFTLDDIRLNNYLSHGKINYPVAV